MACGMPLIQGLKMFRRVSVSSPWTKIPSQESNRIVLQEFIPIANEGHLVQGDALAGLVKEVMEFISV